MAFPPMQPAADADQARQHTYHDGTSRTVQGERGYVIMSSSGTEAVLTVLAKQNAKLGLLFLDIKRAAEALSKLI